MANYAKRAHAAKLRRKKVIASPADEPAIKRQHVAKPVEFYQGAARMLRDIGHESFAGKEFNPQKIRDQQSLTGAQKRALSSAWAHYNEYFKQPVHVVKPDLRTKSGKATLKAAQQQLGGMPKGNKKIKAAIIPKTVPLSTATLKANRRGEVELTEIQWFTRTDPATGKKQSFTSKIRSVGLQFDKRALATNPEQYLRQVLPELGPREHYQIVQGARTSLNAGDRAWTIARILKLMHEYPKSKKDNRRGWQNWLNGVRIMEAQGRKPWVSIGSEGRRMRAEHREQTKAHYAELIEAKERERQRLKKRRHRARKGNL